MSDKKKLEMLDDEIWLKYTHLRYLTVKETKYRLEKSAGNLHADWRELEKKIVSLRMSASIPFNLKTIDKRFWYFPSDSIQKKIHAIESQGHLLWSRIESQKPLKDSLLADSKTEEAITSAIYEGANSTRSQAKALISKGKQPKNKNEWMLVNNYSALEWIKNNLEDDLTVETILTIHKIVSENTLQGDDINFCGKFRDDKVYVGNHLGISYERIKDSLNEVIACISNHSRYVPDLIKAILFHYFIAYIHPFFDGNGRTARTVFYFVALKSKLDFVELLSVSSSLKDHGRQYEKSFDKVVENNFDMTYFIDICLDALLIALDQVEKKLNYILAIPALVEAVNINQNQITLLQKMALNKYRGISIEEHAEEIKKSREIARQELNALQSYALLKAKKEGKKFVYYVDTKKLKSMVYSKI